MNDYEGYEDLKNFTPETLREYRRDLLRKSAAQVDFIIRHTDCRSVFEIGSGNGRLLIGLAVRFPEFVQGVGIDISESRTEFADKWRRDLGYHDRLNFAAKDMRDLIYCNNFDLAVCITGCFQYFDESDAKGCLSLMRGAADKALFELYKRPANPRSWHKLPDSDPFMYLLDDYTPSNPTTHTKTFIKRDGTIDVRKEQLYYYGHAEFLNLLDRAGFKTIHWDKENSTTRVVLVS